MNAKTKIALLDDSCKKILQLPKIRFVGVIDKMGNKIAGGFKDGIVSYLEDHEDRMMYVQITLEYLMRTDFDEQLGPVDYIVSRRKKIVLISIPTQVYLVFISAERDVDVKEIIGHVNKAFTNLPDIVP